MCIKCQSSIVLGEHQIEFHDLSIENILLYKSAVSDNIEGHLQRIELILSTMFVCVPSHIHVCAFLSVCDVIKTVSMPSRHADAAMSVDLNRGL